MFQAGPSKGGHFAGSAQSGGYNHNHASAMGHAASARLNIARQLGGQAQGPVGPVQPVQPVGGVPPVQPTQPVQPQHPMGAGNFRAGVAQHAASMGVPAGVPDIHAAIDTLAHKGQLTPFQASALKQHQGPLQGPQGAQTTKMIAHQVVANASGRP